MSEQIMTSTQEKLRSATSAAAVAGDSIAEPDTTTDDFLLARERKRATQAFKAWRRTRRIDFRLPDPCVDHLDAVVVAINSMGAGDPDWKKLTRTTTVRWLIGQAHNKLVTKAGMPDPMFRIVDVPKELTAEQEDELAWRAGDE